MKNKAGFTLIELSIVIAIIAILAALVLPNLNEWLDRYRLKGASKDLHSNMHFAKMGAIRSNTRWAIIFDTASSPGRYFICSGNGGTDGVWDGGAALAGDDPVERTVNLSEYSSGVDFGHGNATNSILGGAWGDHVTYADAALPQNVVEFRPEGGSSLSGYVYLDNENNDISYAIGTLSSGVVRLRKWAGSWKQ